MIALRSQLEQRETGKMKHDKWYGYVYPKSLTLFTKPKLLVPSIAQQPEFTCDLNGIAYFAGSGGGGGGGYGITFLKQNPHQMIYVLGMLNSKVTAYFMKQISSPFREGWFAYSKQYISRIPIPDASEAKHDRMVELVQTMLRLKSEHTAAEAAFDDRRHQLAEQIAYTDRQIDNLVYELYGLTEAEIRIVEGA